MTVSVDTPVTTRPRARPRGAVLAVVAALHLLGWGSLFFLVAPAQFDLPAAGGVFGIGLGVTAYTLGVRHAFDADHIAAIDNTTRRLLLEGRPASTVGFWFSMGHSTVVVGLSLLLALGLSSLVGEATSESSAWATFTSVWGPLVAGLFLLAIAASNVVTARHLMRGEPVHAHTSGPVVRVLDRVGAQMRTPRQMYFVGLLFGLGFDTATEVSLLLLAGSAGLGSLPWWAILTLPVLFTAGMSVFDLAQGWMAGHAYGWADEHPRRLLAYNLVVTGVSVGVAFVVGATSLSGAMHTWFGTADIMAWTEGVGIEEWGAGLAALLLLAWVVAMLAGRNLRSR